MKKIRRLLYLLLLISTIYGCHTGRTHQMLVEADTLVEHQPNVVYKELRYLDTTLLASEADRALYGLLFSQAAYKCEKKADTTLLSRSIHYFAGQDNARLLQRCYYYHGAINQENRGPLKVTFRDYKNAERLISESDDSIMENRIYDGLMRINFYNWNPPAALHYARMNLITAKHLRDTDAIAGALNNVMISFIQNDNRDSSFCYLGQALSYCEKNISHVTKEEIYQNAAFCFDNYKGDFRTAEKYLKLEREHDKSGLADYPLAHVYMKTHRQKEACAILHKLLKSNNYFARVDANCMLGDYYMSIGDYENAYLYQVCGDSLQLHLQDNVKEVEIKEIQAKYNAEKLSADNDRKVRNIIIVFLAVLTSALSVIVLVFYNIRRKERLIKILEHRIADSDQKIKQIQSDTGKTFREKMTEMKILIDDKQALICQLESRMKNVSVENENNKKALNDMSDGLQWLFYVMNNEEHLQMTKNEKLKFINCYRLLDEAFVEKIEQADGGAATVMEKILSILYRIGKNQTEICAILSLSNDAYRQLKYRTVKRLKTDPSLLSFCDKIGL